MEASTTADVVMQKGPIFISDVTASGEVISANELIKNISVVLNERMKNNQNQRLYAYDIRL
ncbi:MAG: hypothetical protein LBD21_07930 [Tannerellaceae bacterium]|jgi:hypothetical protein|nr:hypothetical protein [Tannerellaceae bacterium]